MLLVVMAGFVQLLFLLLLRLLRSSCSYAFTHYLFISIIQLFFNLYFSFPTLPFFYLLYFLSFLNIYKIYSIHTQPIFQIILYLHVHTPLSTIHPFYAYIGKKKIVKILNFRGSCTTQTSSQI